MQVVEGPLSPTLVEIHVIGSPGQQGPAGDWFDFYEYDGVTGGTIAPGRSQIMVARRDSSSSAGPFIMRDAGLTAPPGGLYKQSADGHYWQHYEAVADCRKIGMSPSRDAVTNGNLLREAIAYALARKAAVYLPGDEGVYVVSPVSTGGYVANVPSGTIGFALFGAGIGITRLKLADGIDSGFLNCTNGKNIVIRDLTVDCNFPGQLQVVRPHGIRFDKADDVEVSNVEILDSPAYGIGFEGTSSGENSSRVLLAYNRIYRSRIDGIDTKNPAPYGNSHFFIIGNYIEDHDLNRGDADGAGIDCRAPATIIGNEVRFRDSNSQGVGIRARNPDGGPGNPGGGKLTAISGNRVIVEAGHTGITVGFGAGDDYVRMMGNYVGGASSNAYQVAGRGTQCIANVAAGCGRGFFCYDTLSDSIVAENIVINASIEGIRVDGSANLTLRGNKIIGNDAVGTIGLIQAAPATNLKAFENEISGMETHVQGFASGFHANNFGRWPGYGTTPAAGVTIENLGGTINRRTVFTFTNCSIPLADAPGVGAWGALKIYDFPAGVILMQSCTVNLAITKSAAGVTNTWNGDFAIGTLPIGGAGTPITSFGANIVANQSTPAAVAGATTARGASTASATFDGATGNPTDMNFNVRVDDADQSVDVTPTNLIFNGTITLAWINAGDF